MTCSTQTHQDQHSEHASTLPRLNHQMQLNQYNAMIRNPREPTPPKTERETWSTECNSWPRMFLLNSTIMSTESFYTLTRVLDQTS